MGRPAMTGSLTVRLGAKSLKLVRAQARKQKVSASDVVRELIERSFGDPAHDVSAWNLTHEWVGAVHDRSLPPGASAREALAEWKPDRR